MRNAVLRFRNPGQAERRCKGGEGHGTVSGAKGVLCGLRDSSCVKALSALAHVIGFFSSWTTWNQNSSSEFY